MPRKKSGNSVTGVTTKPWSQQRFPKDETCKSWVLRLSRHYSNLVKMGRRPCPGERRANTETWEKLSSHRPLTWIMSWHTSNVHGLFFFWLHWVFAVICKLPTVVVCLVVEHRLYLGHVGLGVMAQGLNFPMACGVFPNQELNPCPLHCKADS